MKKKSSLFFYNWMVKENSPRFWHINQAVVWITTMSLDWLRFFSHCLCNIFLQWNDWWSLAMLKCNQNDLKHVWIRTIWVAVFLQNAWNLLKILPNVFFFLDDFHSSRRSLWHSPSMTFTGRKHRQKIIDSHGLLMGSFVFRAIKAILKKPG